MNPILPKTIDYKNLVEKKEWKEEEERREFLDL